MMSFVARGCGRHRLWFSSALATVALLAAACGSSSPPTAASSPKPGGTLNTAFPADPPAFNPDTSTNYEQQIIGCMVYESLVWINEQGQFQPRLAKSWTISPDGLTYTFNLVTASWQDGQPFTSADVKYSLLNVSTPYGGVFHPAGQDIASIDTPSTQQVIIHLKHTFGPFLFALGCSQGGAILPAHLLQGTDVLTNLATTTKPVGTGPFMLTNWVRGQSLTFTRNPHYWQSGLPYLNTIQIQIIPSASSANLALLAGSLDYVYGPFFPSTDYSAVRADHNLKLVATGTAAGDDILFFNTRQGPTSNAKVRQALFTAIDRNYLLKAVWNSEGQVGISSIGPRIAWAYNPAVNYSTTYAYDVSKAKQMLDAAGYPVRSNGSRFTLNFFERSDLTDYDTAAQAIEQMWKAVGINVQLSVVSLDQWEAEVFAAHPTSWDATIEGYTSYGDPALGIARQFVTTSIGKPFGNVSGYSNPAVDQLFQEGADASTMSKRASYYMQAQVIIANDLPSASLHVPQVYDAATAKMQGFWTSEFYGDWATTSLS